MLPFWQVCIWERQAGNIIYSSVFIAWGVLSSLILAYHIQLDQQFMHFSFYVWLFLQWNIATMRATMKYCSSLPIRLWKPVEHLLWSAHPTVIKLRYEFWSVGRVGPDSTHEQNHCTEVVNKHLHCPAEGTTKTQQCTVVDMLECLTEVSLRQTLS